MITRGTTQAKIDRRGVRLLCTGQLTIILMTFSWPVCRLNAQASQRPSDEARIGRVLNGLRPPVSIRGRSPVLFAIGDRMAAEHVPGISIAVVDAGKIAWSRGIGLKEVGTASPVTTTTLFEAQSISKAVAATAALVLVNSGQIDLDQSPNMYLKSWKLPYNDFQAHHSVTIREVLSHSSGLNVGSFEGYRPAEQIPTLSQILNGEKPAKNPPVRVNSVPGSMFRYSGGGAEVMQQLLCDVVQEPFPALMRHLVLAPLEMNSSTYEQPLPSDRQAEAASGHDGNGAVIEGNWPIQPELAAAGLWTTPTDLAKWELTIAKAWQGERTALFSKRIATEMITVQKAPYGLGVEVQGKGPALEFSHGGSNSGFRALAVMFPAVSKGAVIMANGDRADALIEELLTSIATEYGWPARAQVERNIVSLSTGQLNAVVGTYALPPGPSGAPVTYEVTREGNRVFAQIKGLASYPKGEIYPASPSSFFTLGGIDTTFDLDSSGRSTGLSFGSIHGSRVPNVPN